jgi:MYXO-CTERM domain-containing protein
LTPDVAEASHFRGGTLSYVVVGGSTSRTVRFTVETYFSSPGGTGTFFFGDGKTYSMRPSFTRLPDGTLKYTISFNHTYAKTGTYTAYWSDCCWISGISNRSRYWTHRIKVVLDGKNKGDAQFNSPAFFTTCTNAPFITNVNASDPARLKLSYALSNSPSGMVIDQTGKITWSSPRSGRHVFAVTVTNTSGVTTFREVLLTVSGSCNNKAPVLTLSKTTATIKPGTRVCTDVQATDPDRNSVQFLVNPAKAGATKPPTGYKASGTKWTWCWTPVKADEGTTHSILFTAVDNGRPILNAQKRFFITVSAGVAPTITLTPTGTSKTVNEGGTLTFQAKAADPDGNGIASFTVTGLPSFCSKSPATSTSTYTISCKPGYTHGTKVYNVTFTAVDKDGKPKTTKVAVVITVRDVNRPPSITSKPATTAIEDKKYTYSAKANDPDGDKLTWSVTAKPSSASFNTSTGVLTWTPKDADAGKTFSFGVKVCDSKGACATQTWKVKVTNVNDAPKITSKPPTTATEDKLYLYKPVVFDPDTGDTQTWKILKGPKGAKIDQKTGKLDWTPGDDEAGKTVDFEVQVCDKSGVCIKQTWKVKVTNVNDDPTITSKPPTTAEQDKTYTYSPKAFDPDPGEVLTWSSSKLPKGAKMDPKTGKITWTPKNADVGKKADFEIKVCDKAKKCATQKWSVTPKNVNDAPTILPGTPKDTAYVGQKYEFEPKASDPDANDKLTWRKAKGPAAATVDPKTGKVTWTPGDGDSDKEVEFEIEVCDNGTPKKCAKKSWKVKVLKKCAIDTDCPGDQICAAGICREPGCSSKKPCKQGEFCFDGKCKKDLCASKSCAPGEYCRPTDGKCIKPCANVKCQSGEVCKEGSCVKDPCAATPCKSDEICDATTDPKNPTCVKNKCKAGSCKDGRQCTKEGKCSNETCSLITCPDKKQRCVVDRCVERQPCGVDNQCPGSEICSGKLCYPWGCYAPKASCKKGEVCISGNCNNNPCVAQDGKAKCNPNVEFCRQYDAGGVCAKPCASVKCKSGEMCVDGACVKDPCDGVTCKAGEVCVEGSCEGERCNASNVCKHSRVCNPNKNKCEDDQCFGVKCPDSKQVCKFGQCVAPPTCNNDGDCPGDQLCVQNKCVIPECNTSKDCQSGELCVDGKCKKDPCDGKTCPDGEFCRNGQCVGSCAGVFCKDGEVCVDGKCTADTCKDKKCPAGEVCKGGQCVKDPCEKASCKGERICKDGRCVNPPCTGVTCPSGQTCTDGQCTGDRDCKLDKDCPSTSICVSGKCTPPGCHDSTCKDSSELCTDGKCTNNPCGNRNCADDEYCRPSDGTCVKTCPTCPDGKVCKDGKCEDDPCKDVTCNSGEKCVDGSCEKDACLNAGDQPCKFNRKCQDSKCTNDPCLGVTCKDGETCKAGICYGAKPKEEEPAVEPTPDAGPDEPAVVDKDQADKGDGTKQVDFTPIVSGGCACSASKTQGVPGALLFFLLLLGVGTLRRRRR